MISSSESDSKFSLSARPLIGNKGRAGLGRMGSNEPSSESEDSTTLRTTEARSETRLAEAALTAPLRELRRVRGVDAARVELRDGRGGVCVGGIVRVCR